MSTTDRILTTLAALGTGAMGGVFFAFSTFVMAGLTRLPRAQGLAAMQSINTAAPSPAFMTGLFGTAALCVVVGVRSIGNLGEARAAWVLAACALYLLGAIVLTIAYHVPLNDSLAGVNPTDAGADQEWVEYATAWTRWNHVRTGAALASAAILIGSLASAPEDRADPADRAIAGHDLPR